jgi:hypothetical protein
VRKTGAPAAADSILGFHRKRSRDDEVGPFLTFFALAVAKVVIWLVF